MLLMQLPAVSKATSLDAGVSADCLLSSVVAGGGPSINICKHSDVNSIHFRLNLYRLRSSLISRNTGLCL